MSYTKIHQTLSHTPAGNMCIVREHNKVLTVYKTICNTFRLPKGRSLYTTKVVMHVAFDHSQLETKESYLY